MEIVKTTEEYQIIKKRSGRYGVRGPDRKWVTGDDKEKILVAEGLIKSTEPKAEPEPEQETAPEEPGEETATEETEDAEPGDSD